MGKDTALHTCLTAWTTSWMWELLISLLSLLIQLEFYKGTESINYPKGRTDKNSSLKQGGAERPTWKMGKDYWEPWVYFLVKTL